MSQESPLAAIPERLLMGPGPSNVHPRVYQALAAPLVGHLDPAFMRIMEHVKMRLRETMRTANEFTIPLSGTGSSGMEAALLNVLEPGDKALVCIAGVFGTRMKDIVGRAGAEAITVDATWGEAIDPDAVRKGLAAAGKVKLVAIVHAETSTGVLQPLEEISRIVHEAGALFLVDTVTSLGGVPVEVDAWNLDIVYSGTQKCLSCPPGLAPITFNTAALDAIRARKTPVRSWYLDMSMLMKYWGPERVYHHTAPISMNYALAAALDVIADEGLEARFERHRLNHRALVVGLEAMGLAMQVAPAIRAPMLNAVRVPEGVDEKRVRIEMLEKMSVEIGAGLGPLAGKIWRIGLMGHTARPENVLRCLAALRWALSTQGCDLPDGTKAATAAFSST